MGTETLHFKVLGEKFHVDPKSDEASAVREKYRGLGMALDAAEGRERIREWTTAVIVPEDRDRWTEAFDSGKLSYAVLRKIEAWMLEFTMNRKQRRRRTARMR